MTNLHSLFDKFNDKITLTKGKRENLKTSRNALRSDFKTWLMTNKKRNLG